MQQYNKPKKTISFDRTLVFKGALFTVAAILLVQLFIVQIVKHEYYQAQALAEHVKLFEVPAKRGSIQLSDGYNAVPVVLNETRYTVYADPVYIQDSTLAAEKLQSVLGGELADITALLQRDSRYVVLAKKIPKDQAERLKTLDIRGVGLKEVSVRTYPQGNIAAHVLGFVNDDGQGQYGVEAYLDESLRGSSGQQKVVTDINGVPLATSNDIVNTQPIPGDDIVLTLDIRLQRIIEEKLKSGVERTRSDRGTAVLIDPNSGDVKAMANYPTYNPADFAKQEDLSVFTNNAISNPWEPGSVMKPLLMATAFETGNAKRSDTYYDPGYVKVADRTIMNALNFGAQTMTMDDILSKSLNTGAVHLLKTLGDGDINTKARMTWYEFLTERYMLNKTTGIELSGESAGYIKEPDQTSGITVRYSNMAFGQGLTVTPLQLAAAYAALVNGGTYYKPTIIHQSITNGNGTNHEPIVIRKNVISKGVSDSVKDMIKRALENNNKRAIRSGYALGAKSGTAQVAGDNGEYKKDAYIGSYIGYIQGKRLEYVLLVRIDEPKLGGFASYHASQVWDDMSNEIIDSIAIEPSN